MRRQGLAATAAITDMPFFADQDRSTLRAIWREAWRKSRQRLPLEPLEAQLVDILELHPEYHAALEPAPEGGEPEWVPESGESNPFLHMGLHAAVRDGVATDRPKGLRAAFQRLLTRCASPHDAEHVLVECLGETLWEAQRSGAPPDESSYLERVLGRLPGR